MSREYIEYKLEHFAIKKQYLDIESFTSVEMKMEDVNVDIHGQFSEILSQKRDHGSRYGMKLGIRIDLMDENRDRIVELEVIGEAVYALKEKYPKEEVQNFIMTVGNSFMFPYLRSTISNLTANSGMKPLILPLYDMRELDFDMVETLE